MARKVSLGARGEVEFPVLDGSEFEDCESAFKQLQSYNGGLLVGRDLGAVIDIAHHALRRVYFPDLTRDEIRAAMRGPTLQVWGLAVIEGFGLGGSGEGAPGEAASPSSST